MKLPHHAMLLFSAVSVLVSVSSSAVAAAPVVRQFQVSGPTIIAFVPSELRSQNDEGAIEGVAHVRFALQDTNACLGTGRVKFELAFAERVVVRNGRNGASFRVSQMGQGVGAVLVEPGRKPKVVYTEHGPSTLQYLLPNAASEYWHEPGCKQ